LRLKKLQILPDFQLQHCVMAQFSSAETKLNKVRNNKPCPIQPYQTISILKRFDGEVVSTNFTVQKA